MKRPALATLSPVAPDSRAGRQPGSGGAKKKPHVPMAKPKIDRSNLPQLETSYTPVTENSSLGKGTYGCVFRATCKTNPQLLVAVKVFDMSEPSLEELAMCEVATLRRLRHENIVTLIGVANDCKNRLCMIMKMAQYTLRQLVPGLKFLTTNKLKNLMMQLLRGLEFCHDSRVMHRDLKPENIVIEQDKCLKLIDFGMSHTLAENYKFYTNQVTTIWYRDPQLSLGTRSYGSEVDMWSCACIFAEMFFCSVMFPGEGTADSLTRIWSLCGSPPVNEYGFWPADVRDALNKMQVNLEQKSRVLVQKFEECAKSKSTERKSRFTREGISLLDCMLQTAPKRRCTAKQLLEHPYFTSEDPKPLDKRLWAREQFVLEAQPQPPPPAKRGAVGGGGAVIKL